MKKNLIMPFLLDPSGLMASKVAKVIELNEERNISTVEKNLIDIALPYISNKLGVPILELQRQENEQAQLFRELLCILFTEDTKLSTVLIGAILGMNRESVELLQAEVQEKLANDSEFKKMYRILVKEVLQNSHVMSNTRNSYFDRFIAKSIGKHVNKQLQE